jgi:hypothetical protein
MESSIPQAGRPFGCGIYSSLTGFPPIQNSIIWQKQLTTLGYVHVRDVADAGATCASDTPSTLTVEAGSQVVFCFMVENIGEATPSR